MSEFFSHVLRKHLLMAGLACASLVLFVAGGCKSSAQSGSLSQNGAQPLNTITNANSTTLYGNSSSTPSQQFGTGNVSRTATYVVAASDAPDHVKAQADYVADGIDDQVEIQAAITALGDKGGIVHLSAGTFTITAAINLAPNALNYEIIEGEGMFKTKLVQGANTNIFEHLRTSGTQSLIITIKDLYIEGNRTKYTGSGIYVTEPNNAKDFRLTRLFIQNFSGYGIYSEIGWGWMVTESIIEYNNTAGIRIVNTRNGFLIANSKIIANAGPAIILSNAGGTRIIGNELGINTGDNGWGIDSTSQSEESRPNIIVGNWIRGNAQGGIRLHQSQYNWLIEGNVIQDNGAYGIRFDAVGGLPMRRNFITGNRIFGQTNSISANYDTAPIEDNIIRDNAVDVLPNISTKNPQSWGSHIDIFTDVLAVNTAGIRSNEALSAATPINFAIDAQPDVPRTLSGHFDTHTNITAYSITITGTDAKASCCGIALDSSDRMPEKMRGFNHVVNGTNSIVLKDGDTVSGMENTILHEIREIMEETFPMVCPAYKPLKTTGKHIAANQFATAVLLPREIFTKKLYKTGFDVIELANLHTKSCSQVLLRIGEVMQGRLFLYAALYEPDPDSNWRVTYWTTSRNHEDFEANVGGLDDFFPRKNRRVAEDSLVDMAIKAGKPCFAERITLLDEMDDEGLAAIANPFSIQGVPSKVALIVLLAQNRELLSPQIERLNPVMVEGFHRHL